jgi:hypothetical protein
VVVVELLVVLLVPVARRLALSGSLTTAVQVTATLASLRRVRVVVVVGQERQAGLRLLRLLVTVATDVPKRLRAFRSFMVPVVVAVGRETLERKVLVVLVVVVTAVLVLRWRRRVRRTRGLAVAVLAAVLTVPVQMVVRVWSSSATSSPSPPTSLPLPFSSEGKTSPATPSDRSSSGAVGTPCMSSRPLRTLR